MDPGRRIIDPHHHLFHRSGHLLRPGADQYLLDDLLANTRAGHDVTHTVFVECGASYRPDGPEALQPVGETEFVAAQARASDATPTRIAGIVAFANLTLGAALDEVLDAHELAGAGRFRGIRHRAARDPALQDPPPAPLLGRDDFRQGVARLGDRGYAFDAWVFHPQLADLADLARAAEQTTIVLEHLGAPLGTGPYRDRGAVRSQWREGMRPLASRPNVVVKLGGIGMGTLFGTGWASRERPPTSDDVVEYWGDDIAWCIDTFGPSRCMFESNYPVDGQSVGYTVLWNAFQKIASGCSDGEQDALFAGTAARVYRVE